MVRKQEAAIRADESRDREKHNRNLISSLKSQLEGKDQGAGTKRKNKRTKQKTLNVKLGK